MLRQTQARKETQNAIGAAGTTMALPVFDREKWQSQDLIIRLMRAYLTGQTSKPISALGLYFQLHNNYLCR